MAAEATPIGAHLPAILETTETVSNAPSIVDWTSVELTNLPDRLDDQTLAMVEALAKSPLPALPACDENHFLKSMRALSLLPRKADDELKGELRVALYQRMIGHHPREAISFLVEQALAECDWFPTPAQCIAIIGRWRRSDDPVRLRNVAQSRARAELQFRFDEILTRLESRSMNQAEIDALPDRMKRIGEERGFLRIVDGRFIIRREPARKALVE